MKHFVIALLFIFGAGVGTVSASVEQDLAKAETLWVPSAYRQDTSSALFLKGRRVTIDGYSDVGGFLPAKQGYLVAVFQRSQRDGDVVVRNPDVGWVAAFYLIDKKGKKIKQVGVVNRAADILVAKDAIYVESVGHDGFSEWVGYTPAGEEVSGPSGVTYATPLANGDWVVQRPAPERRRKDMMLYRERKDGGVEAIGRASLEAGRRAKLVHSVTGAVVNEPNYVDSVRTGYTMMASRESTTLSHDFANWRAWVIDLTANPDRRGWMDPAIKISFTLGTNDELSQKQAERLTKRIPLIKVGNKVYAASQYQERGFFAPQKYGLADLSLEKPARNMKELVELIKGGMNFARGLLGNNTGDVSAHNANDAYVITTPSTAYIAIADRKPENRVVFDLSTDTKEPLPEGLFMRYGITR